MLPNDAVQAAARFRAPMRRGHGTAGTEERFLSPLREGALRRAPSLPPDARSRRERGRVAELNVKLSHEACLELDGEEAALVIAARFDALRAIGCDTAAVVVIVSSCSTRSQ